MAALALGKSSQDHAPITLKAALLLSHMAVHSPLHRQREISNTKNRRYKCLLRSVILVFFTKEICKKIIKLSPPLKIRQKLRWREEIR